MSNIKNKINKILLRHKIRTSPISRTEFNPMTSWKVNEVWPNRSESSRILPLFSLATISESKLVWNKKSLILDFELNKKQKTVDIFSNKILIQASVGKIENCQFKMFSFFTQNKVSREPNLIKLSKYLFSFSVA